MENLYEKYAKVLVDYCTKVKENDLVLIRSGSYLANDLIKELYKRVLKCGAHPIVRVSNEQLSEIFINEANENQLKYIDPITQIEYEKVDKLISIGAPLNVKNMAKCDSRKMAIRSSATKPLSDLMLGRAANGDLDWVIADFPTNALAQEASMSIDEYKKFLVKSCYLEEEDPVKKWVEIGKQQQKYTDYLNTTSKIRIVGEKTDITFSTKGRKWINCCGLNNFPDGEIFTSPVEDSANGKIYFDFPAIYHGNEADKIELTLKNGKIVDIKAQKNERFVKDMLTLDEGASFVGEIAIGTNEMISQITGNILFDEKIGGSIHMACGASYPETGGKNQSGLHWDMIKNMKNSGQIFADDKLIYENGRFII